MAYKTGQEERIKQMLEVHQKAFPGMSVSENTEIKGTSIRKLCEYDAGGFNRVMAWLKGQIASLESQAETPTAVMRKIPEDIAAMEDLYMEARELMLSRNEKYGDSWKVLSIQSMANLIEMKMHRIANMKNEELDPKIEDEFIDSINYGVMGLYKYKQENNEA